MTCVSEGNEVAKNRDRALVDMVRGSTIKLSEHFW